MTTSRVKLESLGLSSSSGSSMSSNLQLIGRVRVENLDSNSTRCHATAGGVAAAKIVLSLMTHGQDLAPNVHRNCQRAQDSLRSDWIEGSRMEIRKDREI